jgi:hippurate hydrolase
VRAFNNETLAPIDRNVRRIANGAASAFGATTEVDFRVVALPLVNGAAEAGFIADAAAELVGASHVDRDSALIMASEDFSYMFNSTPGAYIPHRQRRRAGRLPGS